MSGLDAEALLEPECCTLDLGCGIGRVVVARALGGWCWTLASHDHRGAPAPWDTLVITSGTALIAERHCLVLLRVELEARS